MRIAILGNSGSGKSTLARWLAQQAGAALLDLDSVAWEPGQIAVARPASAATDDVRNFCSTHDSWVVEGCYANLLQATLAFQPRLVLLDPGLAQCLENCRARPWEPHKFASKAEQDQHLAFLLDWVADYYQRDGEMSLAAHAALFASYQGTKHKLEQLPQLQPAEEQILAWTRSPTI
jgi:adenylate kinase family enzyme